MVDCMDKELVVVPCLEVESICSIFWSSAWPLVASVDCVLEGAEFIDCSPGS